MDAIRIRRFGQRVIARKLADSTFRAGYPQMTLALNRTGRPIVYACSWPFFQTLHSETVISSGGLVFQHFFAQ